MTAPAALSGFSSRSGLLLRGFDRRSGTLHVELPREKQGCAHSFDASMQFDPCPGTVTVCVCNAGRSLYPDGWRGYRPFVLNDAGVWSRLDGSEYLDGQFRFPVRAQRRQVSVCWYPPYGAADAAAAASRLAGALGAEVTVEASGFVLVRAGGAEASRIVVVGRQHPGEAVGSWFVHGLMDALADPGVAAGMLSGFELVIAPMAAVAGVREMRHRFTGGRDYNRSWFAGRPPAEIAAVQRAATQRPGRLAVLVDVHGDEVSTVAGYAMYDDGRDGDGGAGRALLAALADGVPAAVRPSPGAARRAARALIRQRRIVLRPAGTAERWAARQGALGVTVELSASSMDPDQAVECGRRVVTAAASALGTAASADGRGR